MGDGVADGQVGLGVAEVEKEDPELDVEGSEVAGRCGGRAAIGVEKVGEARDVHLAFENAVHEADHVRHVAAATEDFQNQPHQLAAHQNGALSIHRHALIDARQKQLIEVSRAVLGVHQLVQLVVVQIDVDVVPRALIARAPKPHKRLQQQQRRCADFGMRIRKQLQQIAALRSVQQTLLQIAHQKLLQLVALEAQLRQQQTRPAAQFPQRRAQMLPDQLVHLAVAQPNPRRILREAGQREQKLHAQNVLVGRVHIRVAPQKRKQKLREVLEVVFLDLRVVRHQTRPEAQQASLVLALRVRRQQLQRVVVQRLHDQHHNPARSLREIRQQIDYAHRLRRRNLLRHVVPIQQIFHGFPTLPRATGLRLTTALRSEHNSRCSAAGSASRSPPAAL